MLLRNTGERARKERPMSNVIRFAPLVALVIYGVSKFSVYVNEPDRPPAYTPTTIQQQQLAPVQQALSEYPAARENLGSMYGAFSTVISADQKIIRTTAEVRQAHTNAGVLAVQAGEIPAIPGLPNAVNKFLEFQIGVENVPITPDKRSQIADAFKALEWATNQ